MYKLFFLTFLIFGSSVFANNEQHTLEAVKDAVLKQQQFNYFLENSSQEERDLLRTSDKRTPIENIMNMDEFTEDNDRLINDITFCKVAFSFNKLRDQEKLVFRTRVSAESETEAKLKIKKQCQNFGEMNGKSSERTDYYCLIASMKSAKCITPSNPTKNQVRNWNWSY